MLKEIHLADSVRTPFGSFAALSPMSRQSSSGKRRRKLQKPKPKPLEKSRYER